MIVFFYDSSELNEFICSPTYPKLSQHKKLLTEDMPTTEKSYVISKAATAGQITPSTAVFGRGTDFFCKDEAVQSNGGVHIIQVRHIFLFVLCVMTSVSSNAIISFGFFLDFLIR